MSFFQQKFFDVSNFVLWSDGPVEGKRAKFIISFRDGNPRFTVYTGVNGKEGIITWPCDTVNFVATLNKLKDIANGENGNKIIVDSLTSVYVDNKITNDKRILSKLVIGKSNEGICYITIIEENKPKIIFEFKSSPYHIFRGKDGEKMPDVHISKSMAIGVADMLLNLVTNVLLQNSQEYYTVNNITLKSTKNSKQENQPQKQELPSTEVTFEDITY